MISATATWIRPFRRSGQLTPSLLRFVSPDLTASRELYPDRTATDSEPGRKGLPRWLAACLVIATLGTTHLSHAEPYLAGMVGATFETNATDIEFKDSRLPPGFTSSNLNHEPSAAYGGKVGYFFESLPWLGGEIEGYSSTPDIKQQDATISAPNLGNVSTTFTETDLRVTVIGINAIVRYPHPTVQPYLGAGLGIFIPDFPRLQTSVEPGLNGLAGVRLKITDHVGLFAEYKFNRATVTIDPTSTALGFEMTYQAHHGMLGLSYHF